MQQTLHRGVKVNPDFTVLRRTAILVETAFLDTEEDFQLRVSHAAVFGHAIASAIDHFLSVHITPEGDLIFEEDEPAPLMWQYIQASTQYEAFVNDMSNKMSKFSFKNDLHLTCQSRTAK